MCVSLGLKKPEDFTVSEAHGYPLVLFSSLYVWASRAVLSMQPCKNISHFQLKLFAFFATSPMKLKVGHSKIRERTTNSKPPGPIITMGRSETLLISSLIAALYQPPQSMQLCWAKTNFLSQTGTFWLFWTQFYHVRDHILSTTGDALSYGSTWFAFGSKIFYVI